MRHTLPAHVDIVLVAALESVGTSVRKLEMFRLRVMNVVKFV